MTVYALEWYCPIEKDEISYKFEAGTSEEAIKTVANKLNRENVNGYYRFMEVLEEGTHKT